MELPYTFSNGYLFLTVELKGIERKFLFDTGAPTQITSALFSEIEPDIINHTEITDASGNKDDLNIIRLKEIKLGELSFTDIPALVSNSDLYTCFGIDGVIGSNVFRNSIIRIESKNGLIIVTDDPTKIDLKITDASPLTIGEPQSYPYFKAGLAGKKTQLVGFDSGSPHFMVMAQVHAKKNMKDHAVEKIESGYGSSSRSLLGIQKSDSVYRIRLASLMISGVEFTNVVAETNNSNKTRLGNKLLTYGNVTIDYINKLFYFETFEQENDLIEKHWLIKPIIADQKLVVGVVWSGLKDQVSAGDQILAIDDEAFETAELCEWLRGKSALFNSKQSAALTIKDSQGVLKRINLIKQ